MSSVQERFQLTAVRVFSFAVCFLISATANASPSITLSKKSGPPTSPILVSGCGFEPNVGVDIYFDRKDEALVVTNSKGEFHGAKVHAPRSARPGEHWVTALERNNDKGAQRPFLVQTNWSQFGFDPYGTRWNPYENVLTRENVGNLDLKWSYATGGAILGSPAVVNGVVYIPSYDSKLYALDATTGAKLWTYTTGSYSNYPVAVADGVVYLPSGDYNLYALNARTGAKLWSYTTGGEVWSAAVVTGGIVYFGSLDGNLYALNARTGAELWSYNSGGGAPQVAVANGIAYVPSGRGYLYALNAMTGQELWGIPVNTAGLSSPAIANGVVYSGGEGPSVSVYGVNASNGAILWENGVCGETLQASPAVADGVVYVYCDNNVLYALNADTGGVLWQYDTGRNGDAPVFSPAVASGVVYGRLGPYSVGALDARDGSVLWSYFSDSWFSDPVVANGVVYVSSIDSNIYAFSLKHSLPEGGSVLNRPDLTTLRPDFGLKASTPVTIDRSP